MKRRQDNEIGECGSDFVQHHREYMASKGISWRTCDAPADVKDSPWFQLCPKREQEVIAFAAVTQPDFIAVDCSQRINRLPLANGNVTIPCTPTMRAFMRVKQRGSPINRMLLGYESLRLQGVPTEVFRGDSKLNVSDPQMLDLAGNAFPSTCLAALLFGIFTSLPPLKDTQRDSDSQDVDMEALYATLTS